MSIDLWARLFKVDVRFLLQAHDELVYDCKVEEKEWIMLKLAALMERTAKKYLIPEVDMKVSYQAGETWTK